MVNLLFTMGSRQICKKMQDAFSGEGEEMNTRFIPLLRDRDLNEFSFLLDLFLAEE